MPIAPGFARTTMKPVRPVSHGLRQNTYGAIWSARSLPPPASFATLARYGLDPSRLGNRPAFRPQVRSAGKEDAARLSHNKNRLVTPVQQFRRTLKGATALRTIAPRVRTLFAGSCPPTALFP